VVGKAEYLEKGANPRFVVTSLPATVWEARPLYEELYCARGEMENRIKEQQLDLFADRTSTELMRSNQLRLYFSTLAYSWLHLLRRVAFAGTEWAQAQGGTWRNRMLKMGALIRISVRRVSISLASGFPYERLVEHAFQRLRALP